MNTDGIRINTCVIIIRDALFPDGCYTFPHNTYRNDKLINNDVSSYTGGVNAIIIGNKSKGYRSFIENPKIE
ncbi:MAG: hypothetical protein PHN88_11375 [Ignavibacteria bacterium]|nr:hypothetical protein [Ignavibacteria bacterium]